MAPSQHDHDFSTRSPEEGHSDEADTETSPESAAVARGAAHTAASSAGRGSASASAVATRGAVAGRLPAASRTAAKARIPKISAPRPAPRVAVPRNVPRNFPKTVKVPRHARLKVKAPRGVQPRGSSSPKISSTRIPKARANTIAKATDRASKGLDVLSAGLEAPAEPNLQDVKQNNTTSQQKKSIAQNIKSMAPTTISIQQLASFGKIFVVNTVLGMAVFATYEGVIESMAPSSNNNDIDTTIGETVVDEETTKDDGATALVSTEETMAKDVTAVIGDNVRENDNNANNYQSAPLSQTIHNLSTEEYENEHEEDAMDRATLPQHFFAGALGGAAHAVLSLALEVKLNIISSNKKLSSPVVGTNSTTFTNLLQRQNKPFNVNVVQVPSMAYSTASIFHHSLAHSILFGSYQMTKRALLQHYLPSSSGSTNSGSSDNTIHVASIAMAGGLAGQFQHVTSHFTEQWLGLAGDEVVKNKSSSASLLRRVTSASWPTWRSTMVAFPPSAIGFLAFEYGKMMIVGDDDT